MKRMIALVLAAALAMLCLAACGGRPAQEVPAVQQQDSTAAAEQSELAPGEEIQAEEPAEESAETGEEPEEEPEAEPAEEAGPAATPAPAVPEGAPSREDIRGHADIAVPKSESWLSAYEIRYVCATGGVAAFLRKAPTTESEEFDSVLEGTELTVLARENGFCLVKTPDKRVGWMGEGVTATDTALLDSLPELGESYWILTKGEGEQNKYACRLGADRRVSAVRFSDGKHYAWNWALSMRRVQIDGIYYVWNGEMFVSRDKYDSPEGKVNYYIIPDPDMSYDQLG